MSGFERKILKFWDAFYENNGYNDVLLGLRNTLLIAVIGLVIGYLVSWAMGMVNFSDIPDFGNLNIPIPCYRYCYRYSYRSSACYA